MYFARNLRKPSLQKSVGESFAPVSLSKLPRFLTNQSHAAATTMASTAHSRRLRSMGQLEQPLGKQPYFNVES